MLMNNKNVAPFAMIHEKAVEHYTSEAEAQILISARLLRSLKVFQLLKSLDRDFGARWARVGNL